MLEQLKEQIQTITSDLGVLVLEVSWQKTSGDKILQVVIDHPQGVDVDLCVAVSNSIDTVVDEFAAEEDNFYLEVTSAGAERPFSSFEELQGAIGSWIYVQLKEPKQGSHEYTGTLLAATADKQITIAYRDKTRTKEIIVSYDEVANIRRAVKI